MLPPITNKAQAMAEFARLTRLHGLQWTAKQSAADYARLAECNKYLTTQDRRAALGLPR